MIQDNLNGGTMTQVFQLKSGAFLTQESLSAIWQSKIYIISPEDVKINEVRTIALSNKREIVIT
jgi:hypothetical protein